MKLFRFCSTATLSFMMAGVLAAQAPPPQSTQPPAQRPQTPDAAEMTIVGCLAQAPGATDSYTLSVVPAGAQQAAGAAKAGEATRATNPDPARTPPDVARTGAAATQPASYKIVGIAADQLKPHVNHQIELKGRVEATSGSPAQTQPAGQAPAVKEFRATSVKMVSATCPPAM